MALQAAFVLAGLAVLLVAGDLVVRGAVNASLKLGIPALLVGLTVVACGTSAPELLVAVNAVLSGAPGLALGNVVGSNTANILLVLGVPAMIAAIGAPDDRDTRRSYVAMLGVSAGFVALCFLGPLRWPHALLLLAGFAWMLADAWRSAGRHRNGPLAAPELAAADPTMSWWRIAALLGVGVAGLPLGADLLVRGAVAIAGALGVSDVVIGLTVVAVGTSLPELGTTVMAALRREGGVALGNVIGSNMFNILAIIGISGLIGPLPVPAAMLRVDLWVMLGAALVVAPLMLGGVALGRRWGLGLTAAYAVYVVALFANGGTW